MPSEMFGRQLSLMAQALQQAANIVLHHEIEVMSEWVSECVKLIAVASDGQSRSSEDQHILIAD